MNSYLNSLKVYCYWLIFLVSLAIVAKLLFTPLAVVLLLFCLFVPSDRARVSMIKQNQSIPSKQHSWYYIVSFSMIPFIFGVYSAATGDLEPNVHRANAVVIGITFWGIFTFGFNALLFKNKAMWLRAQKRITNASSTRT